MRNNNLALVDLDVTAAVQAARTAGQPAVTVAVRVTGTNSITYTANSREATSGRPTLLVAGV